MSLLFPLSSDHGALVSQDYRVLFREGVFGIPYDTEKTERLIQPASLDTLSEGHCYWVQPGFRPEPGLSVLESVRLTHQRMPQPIAIPASGFVAQRDFTWLIPLKGDFFLPDGYWMTSSPKSTQGRLGNRVRLIADGQPCYDLVKGPWKGKLYVLFEPQCWANTIYEDLSFNQLRFFLGRDNLISDDEISRRWLKEGLIRNLNGEPVPLSNPHTLHNGVLMTLDLLGNSSYGIIAFTAVPNPKPLDQRGAHDWQEYFAAVERPETRRLQVDANLMILNTLFRHVVPSDLCAEMTPYSSEVGDVKLHEAGFFDPGFEGEGVKEVWKKERLALTLVHGQNAGRLIYFRNRSIPDKIYGQAIGSSYDKQVGPRLAKQFGVLTSQVFSEIAYSINKYNEPILVVPRMRILEQELQGFKPSEDMSSLEGIINAHGEFRKRGDMESNPEFKQPIPYVILVDQTTHAIFGYQRSSDPSAYHEKRLHGKWSIGVGGHVRPRDGSVPMDAIRSALLRELHEEVYLPEQIQLRFRGLLNDDRDAVGRVHVGLVYIGEVKEGEVQPKDSELRQGRFLQREELFKLEDQPGVEVEGWSRILIEAIKEGKL